MNYKSTGFRALYHQFCIFPITKNTKAALMNFPNAEKANGVLTYGYYDREVGFTLEVLAAAQVKGEKAIFGETSEYTRSIIRIEAVEEDDFIFLADEDGSLAKRYAKKLELVHSYDADEAVEKTREMQFLDGCRDENFIDDVLVYLNKSENNLEGCWVRIVGLGEHWFKGILLNEPYQDFGYHKGEKITFFVHKTEDENIFCYSDMNPSETITPEDLEDGSMLEVAATKFNNERNATKQISTLEILKDNFIWIPCSSGMSEADQERIETMINGLENKDNPDELAEK